MIIKLSYEDLVRISDRSYQSVVRATKALLGSAKSGPHPRKLEIDDVMGVYFLGLLADQGMTYRRAAKVVSLLMDGLAKVGLLPSILGDQEASAPRIVCRILTLEDCIELRTFGRWPQRNPPG